MQLRFDLSRCIHKKCEIILVVCIWNSFYRIPSASWHLVWNHFLRVKSNTTIEMRHIQKIKKIYSHLWLFRMLFIKEYVESFQNYCLKEPQRKFICEVSILGQINFSHIVYIWLRVAQGKKKILGKEKRKTERKRKKCWREKGVKYP